MLPQGGVDTTCLIVRPFGTDPDPADILHPCKFNKFCWKNPAPKGRFQSYAHLRSHQSATIDWDACIAVEPYVDVRDGVTRTLGANELVYADGDEVYLPDAFGERFAVVFVSMEGTPPFHWRKAYLLRQTGEWLMAFNLVVQEQDGAPSVNGVETIQVDQAKGLRVTTPAAGTALISQDAFVASGASHKPGGVPDTSATAGTRLFLREDSTWAAAHAYTVDAYTGPTAGGGADDAWVTLQVGQAPGVGTFFWVLSLEYNLSGVGGTGNMRLYNATAAAAISASAVRVGTLPGDTGQTNTYSGKFTLADADTIEVQFMRNGGGPTFTVVQYHLMIILL